MPIFPLKYSLAYSISGAIRVFKCYLPALHEILKQKFSMMLANKRRPGVWAWKHFAVCWRFSKSQPTLNCILNSSSALRLFKCSNVHIYLGMRDILSSESRHWGSSKHLNWCRCNSQPNNLERSTGQSSQVPRWTSSSGTLNFSTAFKYLNWKVST